ncbi:MAG TPA: hypothetical protein VFW62_12550, partial [bacterium]|nr:hypothetical protein [bacterium]
AIKFLGPDLLGAVGDDGTFLNGSSGGSVWVEQETANSNDLNDFQFVDSQFGIAVGNRSVILRTFNGGLDWIGSFLPAQVDLQAVAFADLQTGWVGGGLGSIYKSVDGGQAWSLRSTGTQSMIFDIWLLDAQRIWAVGAAGVVLFSGDGGDTWGPHGPGSVPNDLHRIFFQPDGLTGILLGNQYLARTFDGGDTWEDLTPNLPAPLVDYADMAVIGDVVVVVGEDETILRSDDFGSSFSVLSL